MTLDNGKKIKFDILINTISPDEIFNFKYGRLKFMGEIYIKLYFLKKKFFQKMYFFNIIQMMKALLDL